MRLFFCLPKVVEEVHQIKIYAKKTRHRGRVFHFDTFTSERASARFLTQSWLAYASPQPSPLPDALTYVLCVVTFFQCFLCSLDRFNSHCPLISGLFRKLLVGSSCSSICSAVVPFPATAKVPRALNREPMLSFPDSWLILTSEPGPLNSNH